MSNLLVLREQLDEIGLHARAVINDLHADGKVHSSQLAAEILRILESFSRSSAIGLLVQSIAFEPDFELSSKDSGEVLRITQELCNNVLKHSKAQQLHFEADTQPTNFFIRFAEQQLPANPLPFKAGKGLTSMNERAAAFNGTMQSRFEEGQLITEVIMPLAVL